jgi:hypothetical protein
MSQFGKVLKRACAGAALALGLGCGFAANAADVFITSGNMTDPLVVTLSGPAYNGGVYDAPMQFTTVSNGTILAFCVDVFHDITLGSYSPALDYQIDAHPFATDSNPSLGSTKPYGETLSTTQIEQIARLVNYGTDVFNDNSFSGNKQLELAAVQGAIWQIVVPDETVSNGDAAFTQLEADLTNGLFDPKYGSIGDTVHFLTPAIYASTSGTQSFLFAGGVPEPASWLMMIVGFGAVGAMVRQRRTAIA